MLSFELEQERERETDRQTDRQTETDRQTDRQTDRDGAGCTQVFTEFYPLPFATPYVLQLHPVFAMFDVGRLLQGLVDNS